MRMRNSIFILCLLALAASVQAAELLVPVSAQVQRAGVEIVSRAEAPHPLDCVKLWLVVPKGTTDIKWGCHPEPKLIQVGQELDGEKRIFLIFQAGAPGSYGIFISSVQNGKGHMKKYEVVTEGHVDPFPKPKPKPNPQPTPAPGKRTVIILEESGDKDREKYAPILFSSKLRSYLKQKGHRLEIPDVSDVPMALAQRKLVGQILPRLIIEDGDGKLLFQGPFPSTVDAVIKAIQKYGG